jgi:hypothetical protein
MNGKVVPFIGKDTVSPLKKSSVLPNDFGVHSNFLYSRFSLLSAYFGDDSRFEATFQYIGDVHE